MADRLHILCVDDDDDIRAIAALALRLDPHFNVRLASSGFEALKILRTGDWKPDCILLDARMPDVNGPALYAEIRQLPDYSNTPAIFLTANVGRADRDEYMALGALGVIAKPFDPLTLAAEIRALMMLN